MLMLFVHALAASVPSEDGGCRTVMPWASLWGATARPSAGQVSSGPAFTPDGWGGPRGVLGGAPNIDATLVSVETDHNYSAFGYLEDFWARPLDKDPLMADNGAAPDTPSSGGTPAAIVAQRLGQQLRRLHIY